MNEHFTKEDIQKVNKHMKRYSISLSIIQTQSKTSMKYPYTTTETAKITNSDNAKCWWGCGETGLSDIASRNVKWKTHCEKVW